MTRNAGDPSGDDSGSARSSLPAGLAFFGDRVRATPPSRWPAPTPCERWSVRDVVNHMVSEHRWVADLLAGRSMGEVGDRHDGDLLGDDPVAAWDAAATGSAAAWAAVTDDDACVELSAGLVRLGEYAEQMLLDLAVHGWDVARGAGLDETIPPDLASRVLRYVEPRVERFARSGRFATPAPVDGADQQARLLGLLGRRP